MEKIGLNELSDQLRSGQISEKQMIEGICSFVIKNYPIYGLQKYDEDFRQDVLLCLVEKGHRLLNQFNPAFGDFFTYTYCFICTIINTKIKQQMVQSMKEKINFEECLLSFDEKEEKYHRIDFENFEVPKVPYAASRIPSEEIQDALKSLTLKHENKKLIVLALKSSYYLTDEQIHRICKISGIKKDFFYNMIQQCKDSLDLKSSRREKAQERRNFAYYHHKRYKKIIQKLDTEIAPEKLKKMKEHYIYMEKKHRHNWNRMNSAFEKGHIYLRPTNKTVANLMGICERQVNYYINCARKEYEKEKKKEEND
jgi:hypothetical protein